MIRHALGKLRWRIRHGPEPDYFDIGDRLTMGRHSYGKPRVRWYYGDTASVTIGAFTSIADDVLLTIGGGHPVDWVSTFPFRIQFELPGAHSDGLPESKGDVSIGNDVWIGRGARILSGVTIGDGAVVGAYAVVAKDVPPYSIAVGNPAKVVRQRFSDEQVQALLEIRWWDWSDQAILEAVSLLNSDDIGTFIDRYRARQDRTSVRGSA